ncbi:LPXTG cell wall anchor domain-containing protein, partial [Lentilactobacillus sp.]
TPVQPTETQTVDKVEPKAPTQTKLVDNKVEAPIKLSEATQPVAKRDVSNTPKASGISEATDLQQAQLPQTGDKQSVTPILLGLLLMIVSFGGMALGKKRHGLK